MGVTTESAVTPTVIVATLFLWSVARFCFDSDSIYYCAAIHHTSSIKEHTAQLAQYCATPLVGKTCQTQWQSAVVPAIITRWKVDKLQCSGQNSALTCLSGRSSSTDTGGDVSVLNERPQRHVRAGFCLVFTRIRVINKRKPLHWSLSTFQWVIIAGTTALCHCVWHVLPTRGVVQCWASWVACSLMLKVWCIAAVMYTISSRGRRKATSGQGSRLSLLLRQRIRKRWHKSVAYRECSE